MKSIFTKVNVDGTEKRYDITTEFIYRGSIESIIGLCRYEILECPDEPAHVVVVKVPYQEGSKSPKPLLDKMELVFSTVSGAGIKPAFQWALNADAQTVHDAFLADRAEEQAEREKAKAEAEAAKEAARKAKEAAQKAKADAAKGNGKPAEPTPAKAGKRAVSQEQIRKRTRG